MGLTYVNYLIANVIPGLLPLISIPLYTFLFPPDKYGIYILAVSSVGLISTFTYGWMGQTVMRFFHDREKSRSSNSFLGEVTYIWVRITFTVTILTAIVLFISSRYLNTTTILIILLSLLLLISQSIANIGYQLLRIKEKSRSYAMAKALTPMLKILFVFILSYWFGIGILGLFLATCAAALFAAVFVWAKSHVSLSPIGPKRSTVAKYWSYGAPLVLVSILSWVLSLSDRYIIAYFHGTEMVGIYSVAYNLSTQISSMVYMPIMLAAYPVILSTWTHSGRVEAEKVTRDFLSTFFILVIPACAGFIALSKDILTMISQEAYHEGATLIPWITVGMFFLGLSMYANKAWELNKQTKKLPSIFFIVATMNLGLNFLIIPRYSALGAAITTALSYLTYCVVSIILSRKLFNLKVDMYSLGKVLFATSVMVVVIISLRFVVPRGGVGTALLAVSGTLMYLTIGFSLKLHKVLFKVSEKAGSTHDGSMDSGV